MSIRAVAQSHRTTRWLNVGAFVLAIFGIGVLLLRRTRTHTSTRKAKTAVRIRRCPNCGTEYPEQHAFCGNDGNALLPPE